MVTAADFANLSLFEPYAPLQGLLKTARVVASDEMPRDVVTMNTQVVLHDEMSGEHGVVRVVFPNDADPARGQISVLEPLGVQLLGKSPADVFDCDLADGAPPEDRASHLPAGAQPAYEPRRARLTPSCREPSR